MTSAQPPLVVHINRDRAVTLRRREKGVRYVGGFLQVIVGLLFISVILWMAIPILTDGGDLGSVVLSFGFAVLVSVGLIMLGISSFRYIAKRDAAYWSGENLPFVAFTVHENGLTLPDPDGGDNFEIPWESVRGLTVRVLMIRFRVDPAALPKKYYGQFAFGRSMLDQNAETVRTAMRVLSGNRVG